MHQTQPNFKSELSLGNKVYSTSTLPTPTSPQNVNSNTTYFNNGINFSSQKFNISLE